MAPANNKPLYLQIADTLMDDILAGKYPPDGRIPSVRELAGLAQVNVNTAMRAVEALERDAIAYNRRGLGYFVAPDAPTRIFEHRRREFFSGEMDYFFARLAQLGMTPVQLLQHYETYLNLKDDNAN